MSRYTRDQLRHQLGRRCPELVVLPNSFNQNRSRPGSRPLALMERYGLGLEQPPHLLDQAPLQPGSL